MPTSAAFSSRNSRVSINGSNTLDGTFLLANHWSFATKVDELDVTTFEEFGFCRYEDGLMDGDVSFDGYWDLAVNSVGYVGSVVAANTSPPLVYPGAALTFCRLYVKGANNVSGRNGTPVPAGSTGISNAAAVGVPMYLIPELKLFTCNVDAGVRGTLNVSFSGKTNGAYYFPNQSISMTNPRVTWY
jgi:hypothetical protein